jgi:hypothetical protein
MLNSIRCKCSWILSRCPRTEILEELDEWLDQQTNTITLRPLAYSMLRSIRRKCLQLVTVALSADWDIRWARRAARSQVSRTGTIISRTIISLGYRAIGGLKKLVVEKRYSIDTAPSSRKDPTNPWSESAINDKKAVVLPLSTHAVPLTSEKASDIIYQMSCLLAPRIDSFC